MLAKLRHRSKFRVLKFFLPSFFFIPNLLKLSKTHSHGAELFTLATKIFC